MVGRIWLREERFDAALPLGSRSLRGLTVGQVHEVIRAIRASQPRGSTTTVQYATWVTEAWRVLQWGEPAAKLFWEMLSLQEPRLMSLTGGEEVTAAASSTVPAQVPLSHLILFLWLHLPDALAKVTSHPSSYNIIWPSDSAPLPPQGNSPTLSPGPTTASTGGGASSSMGSTNTAGGSGSSGGGSRVLPGLKSGLSHLSFANSPGHTSPHSPHHHHFQSPRSPRSFQLQAWSKVEAHHLSFFKKHVREILTSLSWSSASGERKDEDQASMFSNESQEAWTIKREEFDALGYLCGGSEVVVTGEGLSSSTYGKLDQEVQQLSDLVPYWWQQAHTDPCPLDLLVAWLEEALCVNERLYPPPPDPFAGGSGQQAMPPSLGASSITSEQTVRGPNSMDVDKVVRPAHHIAPRPIQMSLLHHTTVIKRSPEVGNGERRLYINHCHESQIYVLGPVAFACLVGCTDCTIVVGAVAGLVRVAHCERITLITCCRRLVISNCLDSTFFIFTAFPPALVGENRGCRLAPYNTCYPGLKSHLGATGLPTSSPPAVNCWNSPIDLSSNSVAWMPQAPLRDQHQSPSSSSGTAETTSTMSSPATWSDWVLPAESFHTLSVPVAGDEDDSAQLENPFALPLEYGAVLRERTATVESLRARLVEELNENQRSQVEDYLRAKFLEWLWSSGQMRQVLELIQLEQNHPPPQQGPSSGTSSPSPSQPLSADGST